MGILKSLVKGVTSALPIVGPAVGELVGGIMGHSAQKKANTQNVALQQQQQNWEKEMSGTSYQRAVQDLQAAGLNPMLAYSQGGASTPNVSAATVQPVDALARGVSSAASKAAQQLIVQQQLANIELTRANAAKASAEAKTAEVTSSNAGRRQTLEMETIIQQMQKTINEAHLTVSQEELLRKNMPALIEQAKAQATLSELEIPSAKAEADWWTKIGSLGTGAKEGSNFAKTLTEIMRGLTIMFRSKK